MKRVFDFIVAALGFIVISPLLLLVSGLIYIIDGAPILFIQERIGLREKRFRMLKFRTMRSDLAGAALTVGRDHRITRLGQILRKLKIDELPQLLNVIKGEMSFVGPRPEVLKYVALYSSEQKQVLNLIPGITDPASLKYFNESDLLAMAKDPHEFYVRTIMPDKIRINLEYAKQATFFTDLKVIFKTVFKSAGC
jgi:lipopolysaccharide/colanic/teichoic acid biosynthesis glycosyltransferase